MEGRNFRKENSSENYLPKYRQNDLVSAFLGWPVPVLEIGRYAKRIKTQKHAIEH